MQSGELNRLSFYFDTDTKPWPLEKPWAELVPQEWSTVVISHMRLQASYIYFYVCSNYLSLENAECSIYVRRSIGYILLNFSSHC